MIDAINKKYLVECIRMEKDTIFFNIKAYIWYACKLQDITFKGAIEKKFTIAISNPKQVYTLGFTLVPADTLNDVELDCDIYKTDGTILSQFDNNNDYNYIIGLFFTNYCAYHLANLLLDKIIQKEGFETNVSVVPIEEPNAPKVKSIKDVNKNLLSCDTSSVL